MKEKYFDMSVKEKKRIRKRLKEALQQNSNVLFAYLHGSFIKGRFKDIDLALYLKEVPSSPLDRELQLEVELGEALGRFPVDVRILNGAPLSFRYNVVKDGQRLLVNDDNARTDFAESTVLAYMDFAPFRKMYLKEALGLGI